MFYDYNNLKEVREVYELLEDDCSKDIYLNRLNYLITEDDRYIDHVVQKYLPEVAPGGILIREMQKLISGRELILYGAGRFAKEKMNIWKELNVSYFCDKNETLQETGFCGYQVISLEELFQFHKEAVILITTCIYEEEIKKHLIRLGFLENQLISANDYFVTFCSKKQYFGEDFIVFSDDEVMVDAGAYDLATSEYMLEYNPNIKKIYAFEPDPDNILKCRNKKSALGLDMVEIIPTGTWSDNTELCFRANGDVRSRIAVDDSEMKVLVQKIDDVVKEKVTFIKMDVEGAELESLKGAAETIKRYRPILAISMYHKVSDMTELPRYIKTLVPEYKLYIRHYSERAAETVLYALIDSSIV